MSRGRTSRPRAPAVPAVPRSPCPRRPPPPRAPACGLRVELPRRDRSSPPRAPAPPDPRRLGPFLEEVFQRFHTLAEVEHDPLRFPRRYPDPADAEVAGLIAATFAFGRVNAFLPVLEALLARLGPRPAAALAGADARACEALAGGIRHRWAGPAETAGLLAAIAGLLRRDGGLAPAFLGGFRATGEAFDGLASLSAALRAQAPAAARLVSSAGPADAAKRLCLFLRWMVRDDGIDTGAWRAHLPRSALRVPLDVHVHRLARHLGLLPPGRSGPRRADAIAVTAALAAIDPADPVRFDFALSHLGISGTCTGAPDRAACAMCPLAPACVIGAAR